MRSTRILTVYDRLIFIHNIYVVYTILINVATDDNGQSTKSVKKHSICVMHLHNERFSFIIRSGYMWHAAKCTVFFKFKSSERVRGSGINIALYFYI